MKTMLTVTALLAAMTMFVGCEKKVNLTVYNHSDSPRNLTLTTPEGQMPIGSVGSEGMLSYRMAIKTDNLPANCTLSAGMGSSRNFTVTHHTPGDWWFHITREGVLTGPMGKDDAFMDASQTQEINVRTQGGTLVR